MNVSYEVDLISANKLKKLLSHYTSAKGKSAMRKGCRWGAKIVASAVKADVPVKSGALRGSLRVRAMKRSRKGVGVMAQFGEGWFKGKTFYAAFVEFGHRTGKRTSSGRHFPGADSLNKIPGKFFMMNATKAIGPIAKRVAMQRMIYELEHTAPK